MTDAVEFGVNKNIDWKILLFISPGQSEWIFLLHWPENIVHYRLKRKRIRKKIHIRLFPHSFLFSFLDVHMVVFFVSHANVGRYVIKHIYMTYISYIIWFLSIVNYVYIPQWCCGSRNVRSYWLRLHTDFCSPHHEWLAMTCNGEILAPCCLSLSVMLFK